MCPHRIHELYRPFRWTFIQKCIYMNKMINANITIVSASIKTAFEYCVSLQQWSLVNVTPRSGRERRVRLTVSLLSKTSTISTWLNTVWSVFLYNNIKLINGSYFIVSETERVTMHASCLVVPVLLRDSARTRAPQQYSSVVASVTKASATKIKKI